MGKGYYIFLFMVIAQFCAFGQPNNLIFETMNEYDLAKDDQTWLYYFPTNRICFYKYGDPLEWKNLNKQRLKKITSKEYTIYGVNSYNSFDSIVVCLYKCRVMAKGRKMTVQRLNKTDSMQCRFAYDDSKAVWQMVRNNCCIAFNWTDKPEVYPFSYPDIKPISSSYVLENAPRSIQVYMSNLKLGYDVASLFYITPHFYDSVYAKDYKTISDADTISRLYGLIKNAPYNQHMTNQPKLDVRCKIVFVYYGKDLQLEEIPIYIDPLHFLFNNKIFDTPEELKDLLMLMGT